MKKKFLAAILSLACLVTAFAGCGSPNWSKNVTLNDLSGAVNQTTNGGFSVEKGNYIYFVNGSATYTDGNKFGKPVKGALMVADKTDLTGKSEILVPQMMAAADYTAGIYIFGDYVYYATPTTEKTNKGEIATDYLDIKKTKLDGSVNKTLFRIHGNSAKYKFTQVEDEVFVIYYNQDDTSIETYSDKTGNKTVISKDVKSYFFSTDPNVASVVYTKGVEDPTKLESEDSKEYPFNEVYVVSAGDTEGKRVLNGAGTRHGNTEEGANLEGYTFTLINFSGEYVLYSRQELNNTDYTDYFVTSFADLKEGKAAKQVKDADIMTATALVIAENKFVVNATINGKSVIAVADVNADGTVVKTPVCIESSATLLKVEGNYVYYYNSDSILSKVELLEGSEAETYGKDAYNTSWYMPEFYTIDGKEHILFANAATLGYNYIFDMDLSKDKKQETDDDGKVTEEYWTSEFIGKMTDEDAAARVTSIIGSDLPTSGIDIAEDSEDMVALEKVRAEYNALTDKQKKLVSKDDYAKITDIDDAIAFIKKIEGITLTEETITKNDATSIRKMVEEYGELSSNAQNKIKQNTLNKLWKLHNVIIENEW